MNKNFFNFPILVCAIFLFLIAASKLPVGVPGQWTWLRVPESAAPPFLPVFLPPFLVLMLMVSAILFGMKYCAVNPKKTRWFLCLTLVLGLVFQETLLESGRMGRMENEVAFLDIFTGGYPVEAEKIDEPGKYFRNFAHKLSLDAEKSNHLDVHPPGYVFFSHLVLQFCKKTPVPHGLAQLRQSDFERGEMRKLVLSGALHGVPDRPYIYDAAALLLLLSELGVIFAAWLTVSAVRAAYPKITPANLILIAGGAVIFSSSATLFIGHFDVFALVLGALLVWALVRSYSMSFWAGKALFAALAGLICALACSCSLAFGLFVPFAAALYLLRRDWTKGLPLFGMFCGAGLLFAAALYAFAGVDLVSCAYYAARNNAAFFRESGRAVLPWIPWNLFDLVLFASPLALSLAFAKLFRGKHRFASVPANTFVWALGAMLIFLTVSPFSRGEMGRLLLFVYPAIFFAALRNAASDGDRLQRTPLVAALAAQGVLLIVLRLFLKLALIW